MRLLFLLQNSKILRFSACVKKLKSLARFKEFLIFSGDYRDTFS